MGKYSVLYRLKIEHEYNKNKVCQSIDVRPESSTVKLLQRRGMLFKKSSENEWCLLGDCSMGIPYADTDIFMFNLYLLDPLFTCYTKWNDFNLKKLYLLSLPTLCENFPEAVLCGVGKQKIGSGFCLANLQFNDKCFGNDEPSFDNVLEFQAKEVYWEYVFVRRNAETLDLNRLGGLKLIEENSKIDFSDISDMNASIRTVWKFKSSKPIKMAEYYDCRLSLCNASTFKMLDNIPHPTIGNFSNFEIESNTKLATDVETIRQVCYF